MSDKESPNESNTRPPTLRPETWDFLRSQLSNSLVNEAEILGKGGYEIPGQLSSATILATIAKSPGAALVFLGITQRPDLLRDTVIALQGGVEYLITPEAANEIAAKQPLVQLRRLGGKTGRRFRLNQVLIAITNGECFDQIDVGLA